MSARGRQVRCGLAATSAIWLGLTAASVASADAPGATPTADAGDGAATSGTATDGAATDGDEVEPAVEDRELGARLGVATGGGAGVTPGGVRVSGYYLYQLATSDWFDGTVGFTFGGGGAACFRDRDDAVICEHGGFDGFAGEVSAGVRRFLRPRDAWAPYLRAAVGVRVVSFGDDDLRGLALPVTAGAGVRVRVSDRIAVGADAALELGVGWFGRDLGARLQAGLAVGVGVDFTLQ